MKYRVGQILEISCSSPKIDTYFVTYLGFLFADDCEELEAQFYDVPAVNLLYSDFAGKITPVEDFPQGYWSTGRFWVNNSILPQSFDGKEREEFRLILEERLNERFERYKAFKAAKAAGLIFKKVKLKNQL